jgi:GntR family transcriptional regulator
MADLRIDPSDATPIWSQIEEGLRRLVAAGALKPGAPVPSVRELAKDLRINPATVAKAYQRLTDAGILMVKRGDGTYVAHTPPPISRAERSRTLRDAATRYASLAATLGVTPAESAEALEAAWRSLDPKKGARS